MVGKGQGKAHHSLPRVGALAAALLSGAALLSPLLLRGASGEDAAARPAAANPPAWRIFFTGDTRGYIHPCGCDEGLFGGLPRRATYLAKARTPGDLLLDLGNLIEGTRPHERLKLSYVLQGLKLLDYDILVPGEGELALEEDFERVAAELERPKVICANLVRAGTKRRVFAPWSIHEMPGGTRLAVVGLTSTYQKLPACYTTLAPEDALREAMAALEGKADVVVAAGYLEGKPALDLAAAVPRVAAVLASHVPRGTDDLLHRGGAPVMLGGERGQYVSSVRFTRGGAAASGVRAWLGDDVPDAPALAALVRRHDKDAKQCGEAFARESFAAFREASWVGSVACAECHKDEYAVWEKSKHARAMTTLRERDQHENPNCMKCHLQDLPAGNGTHGVAGIGCESCHGGGQAHVVAMRQGLPRVSMRTFTEAAEESCAGCHDEANSPRFDGETYWARIAHGGATRGEDE